MHALRRNLLVTGASVAVGGLVAAAILFTSPSATPVELAAQTAAPVTPAPTTPTATAKPGNLEKLRSVLLPQSYYPEGTQLTQFTVEQAVAGNLMTNPADIVLTPSTCHAQAFPDMSKLTGWVQQGHRANQTMIHAMAVNIPGGGDFAQVRRDIRSCASGTVEVKSVGLKGVFSLREFAVTGVNGLPSVGVQQTVTFPGNNSDIAKQMALIGTGAQVYTNVGGDVMLVACEANAEWANQSMALMYAGYSGGGTAAAAAPLTQS